MAGLNKNSTLRDLQEFIEIVYGESNDRNYSSWDMLSQVQRFIMRGLKGIRKKDPQKIEANLIISMSWFMSLMSQMHIDMEKEIWKRFPGVCFYCGFCPCNCNNEKSKKIKKVKIAKAVKRLKISDVQSLFKKIYPPTERTIEDAGIHLAEEMGELSEAYMIFRGSHKKEDFLKIKIESADLMSCLMAVFNSLGVNFAEKMASMFSKNCHICKKAPCECDFNFVANFKS